MDTRTWMRYWHRAIGVAALLRCVPFVRMVGLNGSMVTGTFRPESDIDLYIVTKDGHLFLGRFLATVVIRLTGLKIRPGKEAGMICANRFAIESFTEITPHDMYHDRVFHNLIPLFAQGASYEKYRRANRWMHDVAFHRPVLRSGGLSRSIQIIGEMLLSARIFERLAMQWQQNRVANDPRAHEPGSTVIISERELRFHIVKKQHG